MMIGWLLRIYWWFGYYKIHQLASIKPHLPWGVKLIFLPFALLPRSTPNEGLSLFLQRSGPVFVKLGQFLSLRDDLLPSEVTDQLAVLQDRCHPVPVNLIKDLIETSFNTKLEDLFPGFDPVPIATASLAQVHAVGANANGEAMVIKVLKPGVAELIARDLSRLKKLVQLAAKRFTFLPLEDIFSQYETRIQAECDFRQEAARTQKMQRNALNKGYLQFPVIEWDRCNDQVITMTRLDAIRIDDIEYLKQEGVDIKQLAINGTRAFFEQVFFDNFFHGDMHPGNVMVSRGLPAQYASMDCAVTGSMDLAELNLLAEILWLIVERKYQDLAQLLHRVGWTQGSTHWSETEITIMAYCEPLLAKSLQGIELSAIAKDLIKHFNRYGLVFHPHLSLLLKTLSQIEKLGQRLHPELQFWDIVREEVGRYRSEQMKPGALKDSVLKELRLAKIFAPRLLSHLTDIKVAETQSSANLSADSAAQSLASKRSALSLWVVSLVGVVFGYGLAQTTLLATLYKLLT